MPPTPGCRPRPPRVPDTPPRRADRGAPCPARRRRSHARSPAPPPGRRSPSRSRRGARRGRRHARHPPPAAPPRRGRRCRRRRARRPAHRAAAGGARSRARGRGRRACGRDRGGRPRASSAPRRAALGAERGRATFSRTLRLSNRPSPWRVRLTPRRTSSCGGRELRSHRGRRAHRHLFVSGALTVPHQPTGRYVNVARQRRPCRGRRRGIRATLREEICIREVRIPGRSPPECRSPPERDRPRGGVSGGGCRRSCRRRRRTRRRW